MAKIKITNLQQKCQLSLLNASELKQVIGGLPTLASHAYLRAFSKTPVNTALIDAYEQAREAGNRNRADELQGILRQRVNAFIMRRPIVDQIVAPG